MGNTDAEQYRAEWATKLHKNPSEIYVPAALRDVDPEPESPSVGDDGTAVLTVRKGGKIYRLTLDEVEAPFPGRVSGKITAIEEVPSA